MNSVETVTNTQGVDSPLKKNSSIKWAIAKGIASGAARSLAPKTTSLLNQTKALVDELKPEEEKERKKARELFGLSD